MFRSYVISVKDSLSMAFCFELAIFTDYCPDMSTKGFNMLRPQLTPPTAWDKLYKWMVGTARIIVIIVEFIVIIAFGTRVAVDTISKNLDKEIVKLNAELSAYSDSEFIIRNVQDKTNAYQSLWENSSNLSIYIDFINDLIINYPGIISLQISKTEINISGELPLININELETKLKENVESDNITNIRLFNSIEVNTVESEGVNPGEIASFSIRAKLEPQEQNRTLSLN